MHKIHKKIDACVSLLYNVIIVAVSQTRSWHCGVVDRMSTGWLCDDWLLCNGIHVYAFIWDCIGIIK